MILKLDIESTISALLEQEDSDGDKKITIEDKGPKSFRLKDINGSKEITIEGTFYLSNLLQELILAKEQEKGTLDTNTIFEKPALLIFILVKTEWL